MRWHLGGAAVRDISVSLYNWNNSSMGLLRGNDGSAFYGWYPGVPVVASKGTI